ncbi:MAG TPA: FAD-binding oxidoreductase, partial [Steroidobacteraceae bacterium]|nr:FAD-binding oxidoreductase [Steroidobacteraceae bacterium]
MNTELLQALRNVVGPDGVLDQPGDLEPYLIDHRKLYRGQTPMVLRPNTTEQVGSILARCYEANVAVVPAGGNTGYCGGATPSADGSQVVVSLSRMRKVRNVDPLNYALTCEAGCVLADIQSAADAADRFFPLSLGSEGSCQIGGNLSTNAGGTAVVRYGMARSLVLGIEAVLPDGRVFDGLRALRKDNTGYDLRDLFIGAEGTLGIITAATLKLYPKPKTVVTALVALQSLPAAIELLSQLRTASGDAIVTFELMPRIVLDFEFKFLEGFSDPFDKRHDWYVLLEVQSARTDPELIDVMQTSLAAAIETGLIDDAVVAQSEAQRLQLWRMREQIPDGEKRAGASIKHDVSVSITDLPALVQEGSAAMLKIVPQARVVSFGHLGDGNLHFNLNQPEGM